MKEVFQSTPSVWRETISSSAHRTRPRFQSTPSVWRETATAANLSLADGFQSTPSVWRETKNAEITNKDGEISIHSLRVEGDTINLYCSALTDAISIHSLRVEGDWAESPDLTSMSDFNPLPPCGGRRLPFSGSSLAKSISIHSLRVEETFALDFISVPHSISIHSLRVEGDCIIYHKN